MATEQIRNRIMNVINDIDDILNELNSTKTWSLFDMFGGEEFTSFVKRRKMRNANKKIERLSDDLRSLKYELDAHHILIPEELPDTFADNMFDIFIDNFFTDFFVHDQIKSKIGKLEMIKDQLKELLVTI